MQDKHPRTFIVEIQFKFYASKLCVRLWLSGACSIYCLTCAVHTSMCLFGYVEHLLDSHHIYRPYLKWYSFSMPHKISIPSIWSVHSHFILWFKCYALSHFVLNLNLWLLADGKTGLGLGKWKKISGVYLKFNGILSEKRKKQYTWPATAQWERGTIKISDT